jgi:uncharacterized membrane protein (UPF0127 family)
VRGNLSKASSPSSRARWGYSREYHSGKTERPRNRESGICFLMGYKASNLTRNRILAEFLASADTFWSSLLGLMGKPDLPQGSGLLLIPCQSVHTMGMRFPIDVIFMDKRGMIIHLVENMKPWRVSKHFLKSRCVLELSAGTISATGTMLGDIVEIIPE